jgi:cell division protein FtsZ
MTLDLSLPDQIDELKPNITVIGVGGAGGNAVNNMIRCQLSGVEFMAANTDSQALRDNQADHKIQLGLNITHGLGAGSRPDVGRAAAEEALDEIMAHLEGTHMVFITGGMGGGTGTGAAPVIARAAREHGILTVGVVTKPFHFEGRHRMSTAEAGIEELASYVDTLIVIPNQNLFRIANDKTTFAEAFQLADDVLHSGVRGVTDLMVKPGLINLDFADIRAVMREMGKAMMGTGEATGERRAVQAAEAAISNPLLDDASMKGARGVLINITGGNDMTLFEVDEAANRIRDEVDPEANIIFGATFDENSEGVVRVSVVATGIDGLGAFKAPAQKTATAAPPPAEQPLSAANDPGMAGAAAAEAAMDLPMQAAGEPAAAEAEAAAGAAEHAPAATAEQMPPPVHSAAAAGPAAQQQTEAPRQSRWSLFGGVGRQVVRTAKGASAEPFVAASPARPQQGSEEPRRAAVHTRQEAPDQQGESGAPARQGFASLFSRKSPVPPAPAAPRLPIDDGTVHVLPKKSASPAEPPAEPSSQASDDTLEIPAFLRRQAR